MKHNNRFWMTRMTVILAAGLAVFIAGVAKADLTPLSEGSADGDGYWVLYRTVNQMFNGAGLSSNAQLMNQYGIANPGTLDVINGNVFLLSAMNTRPSTLTMFGSTTSQTVGMQGYFDQLGNQLQRPTPERLANTFNSGQDYIWGQRRLLSNYTGLLNFMMTTTSGGNGTYFSNNVDFTNTTWGGSTLDSDVNHFIYFDVTQLMRQTYGDLGFAYTHAYLVAYEDQAYYAANGSIRTGVSGDGMYFDGDYNDGLFLVFSNGFGPNGGFNPDDPGDPGDPGNPGGVPEPATLLLWTLGSLGVAGSSWARKRRMNKLAMS